MDQAGRVQAVLLAGDRRGSRAVRGSSKAYVDVAGRPMVVHVLESLLHARLVSEVYAVGDPVQLEKVIADHGLLALSTSRARPIHIVPQRETLFENVWNGFLRTLPPRDPDPDHAILVAPADIPLVVPEEIDEFLGLAARAEADYVVGLTPAHALGPYAPRDGRPGIEMASFNIREGRFRQNNLHFVRPLRMSKRHYIQDMYDNRYQKQLGNMLRLGWRILVREFRHLWVIFYYLMMHVAAVLDRRGWRRWADALRDRIPIATVERGIGELLGTRFTTVLTGFGGAALDVDNDEDLEAVSKMLFVWKRRQAELARRLDSGPLPEALDHVEEEPPPS